MLKHVVTDYQLADTLTKGVSAELYGHLRDLLMGWTGEFEMYWKGTRKRNGTSSPRVTFREGVLGFSNAQSRLMTARATSFDTSVPEKSSNCKFGNSGTMADP